MKTFNLRLNIGTIRYLVSFHDGVKTHRDGSAAFDVRTFTRKRDMERFVKKLKTDGYTEA